MIDLETTFASKILFQLREEAAQPPTLVRPIDTSK